MVGIRQIELFTEISNTLPFPGRSIFERIFLLSWHQLDRDGTSLSCLLCLATYKHNFSNRWSMLGS